MRGAGEFIFYLAVGAGMALGTSAFTVVGGLFEVAALPFALLGILLGALICIAVALSIGELASMWPSSPAIRTYFKMAFAERAALVLIYIYLAFIVLIAGVESYMFALVVQALVPALAPTLTVVLLLACVVAANAHGVELPRLMQILTTFLCVTIILGMGALGLMALEAGPAETPAAAARWADGIEAVPAATGLAIFLFIGFEWITPVGLRPQSYARMIPLAMLAALLALVLTYCAFAVGLGLSLPRDRIASESTPQVAYFRAVLGREGVWLAGVLSLAAIFSTFNAGLMSGARLLQAMAREGTLPRWAAAINPATGAPLGAVLLLGLLTLSSSLLILALELQLVAAVIGATIICIIYAAYMASVLRLRRTQSETRRAFRTPLPSMVQWFVCLALPLIAVATLFSLPELGLLPAWGLAGCAGLSLLLAEWSARRLTVTRRQRASPQAADG